MVGIQSATTSASSTVSLSGSQCHINTQGFEGPVRATVYSLSGAQVASAAGHTSGAALSLNLGQLNKGIYLVKVSDGKRTETEKIILP